MQNAIAAGTLAAILTSIALALCIVAELISPREKVSIRRRFPGAFFIVLLPFCGALMSVPLAALWHALFKLDPIVNLSGWPAPVIILTSLLAHDFFNYWQHRLDHAAFWPVHAMHHAQTDLHAANGFGHPLQLFSEFLAISIPLSLIDTGGIESPIAVGLIASVQAMIIHSPLRVHFGPLRRILNDSRFHRIHHSLESHHFGKNFGTIFTIWDQLFGTAYFPRHDEWPGVGVEGLPPPKTIRQIVFYPARFISRRRSVTSSA